MEFVRAPFLRPKITTTNKKSTSQENRFTMGVTGDLLPRILKTAGRKVNLATYKDGIVDSSTKNDSNKRQRTSSRRPIRIGLDVGTMIARAAHGCGSMLLDERHLTNYGRSLLEAEANGAEPSAEQAMTSDENRRAYVNRCCNFVMQRIHTLKNVSGAELLVVFDGATPPIKDEECIRRSQKRKQAEQERDEPLVADEAAGANTKRRVRAARRAGAGKNHGDILVEVMQALRKAKIPFMVSPYEADGQLAYLSQNGLVDLVVTEDSDLIAHGCDSILYKTIEGLGKGFAEGILVQRGDLGAMGLLQKCLSLQDFSDVMLAVMFVALGCDYCSSLKQIGSVAAKEIVRIAFHGEKGESEEERQKPALQKVFEGLYRSTSEKNILTADFKKEYESGFLEALLMYRHPMIYDPFLGKCVLLRNPPHGSDPELLEYEPYARLCNDVRRREQILGTCHGPGTSTRIAEGWISPRTKRPYENMEVPPNAREPPLSLSASESDEDEGGDQVLTQEDAQPPAAATSQTADDTQGQDTQPPDSQGPDSQGQDTQGPESRGRDTQDPEAQDPDTQGPDTQDLGHVETQMVATAARDTTQVGAPSSQPSQATPTERIFAFTSMFLQKKLGFALNPSFVVTHVSDRQKAGYFVQAGDELVGINGSTIPPLSSVEQVKDLLYTVPRPVVINFRRRVIVEDNVATQGSTQQSPLTGSSSSRLDSQPSQFSAESQMSPGVRSPSLLDSQPS